MTKKVLVIYAYPHHKSLNGEILNRILNKIVEKKYEYQLVDLYQEKFNPILYFDETLTRRSIKDREDTQSYRNQILWADQLMFIFPIWWGGAPSILKGYFDKVLATEFAYKFNGLFPQGLLKGKSAAIITTDDTPPLFRVLKMQDYGNVLKKQILRTMCGIKIDKHIRFSYVKGRKQATIDKWLNKCTIAV